MDQIYDIQLRDVADPITHAWHCGRNAAKLGAWDNKFVLTFYEKMNKLNF